MTEDPAKPTTPALNVDLASRYLTHGLMLAANVDALIFDSVKTVEASGHPRGDATEIVRRAWMSVLIGFCRHRGYGADQIADQLEALALRIRSGDAAQKADEYDAELVRRGLIAIEEDADKGESLR